ncbi:unnamed protein product [[Candida] boidinii]|uniref:Unnamed protein product n=1 Tax=Candida boidinii TaxID=5477 RepID=A0ACB5TRK9_CANBO|nr:unnamed protein product [[Candida] boidinii]
MSFVARRQLSTLIPPKIASAANIGSNPAAKRMQSIVSFYEKLPRGAASFAKASTPVGIYREKFFESGSGKPLFHLSVGLLLLGYGLEYFFHLRHHKGEEH